MEPHRLTLENIKKGSLIIDPIFRNTPHFFSEYFNHKLGTNLITKIETLNPVGSFKGRGTDLLVSKVDKEKPIICASAGNFGIAMAYSCRKFKAKLTVYASENANPYKIETIKFFGAEVILTGKDFDEAKLAAKKRSKQFDFRFVEDGSDIETLEGAGTIALELLECATKLDMLFIPLGNGALFTGIARVFKELSPLTKLIAVQAKGAPAMVESLKAGKIISYENINTIADGIAIRIPIPQSLEDIKNLVDYTLLVSDKEIISSMKLIQKNMGIICEPSGVIGIAGILKHKKKISNKAIATIITGRNIS